MKTPPAQLVRGRDRFFIELLRFYFVNADLLSVFAQSFKADDAVDKREKGIVFADADVVAGVELGAALTDENIARKHFLPVRTLYAEAFRLAVAPVVGRAGSLFMSKQTAVSYTHLTLPTILRV